MFNVVFSQEYQVIPGFMKRMREAKDLSQQDVAVRLERSQSHIYKLETGQRPVEIVEFCRFAAAVGMDPLDAFTSLFRDLEPLLRLPAVET